jgi:hypothetical protein
MKSLFARLLGEDPSEAYNAHKYAIEAPRLYGAAQPGRRAPPQQQPSAQEPVSLGCWVVPPENNEITGARRQLVSDGVVPRVPQEIAVAAPCQGPQTTSALYGPETFLTPFDRAQDMVATGSLINTYTGEVSSCFEDGLPPPDRQPGDVQRERKSAQLRLLAAEGNAPAGRHKREQEDPMQAGDSGKILTASMYRVNAGVQHERAERSERDLYFNRNELAPTELMQTRNPFGFDGYSNRIRIQPYMPVTQELDNKSWAPNATLLPGTSTAPRAAHRLSVDARPGAVGPSECCTHTEPGQLLAQVRPSSAARDAQRESKFNVAAELYGNGAPQGPRELREARAQASRAGGAEYRDGGLCASAESVLETLRGAPTFEAARSCQAIAAQAHAGAQRARANGSSEAASRSSAAPPSACAVTAAQMEELPLEARPQHRPIPQANFERTGLAGELATARPERDSATCGSQNARGPEGAAASGGAVEGGYEAFPSAQTRAHVLPSAANVPGEQETRKEAHQSAQTRAHGAVTAATAPGEQQVRRGASQPSAERRPDALPAGACAWNQTSTSQERPLWRSKPARSDVAASATSAHGSRRHTLRPEWLVNPGSGSVTYGNSLAAPPAAGVASAKLIVPTRAYAQAESTSLVNASAHRSTWRRAMDAPVAGVAPSPSWSAPGVLAAALEVQRIGEPQVNAPRCEASYTANFASTGATSVRAEELRRGGTQGVCAPQAPPAAGAMELHAETAHERVGAECFGERACGAPAGEASLRALRALASSACADAPAEAALALCGSTLLRAPTAPPDEERAWRGGALEIAARKDPSAFFVSDARGLHDVFRPVFALVGGDVSEDPLRRFGLGVREWRPEVIIASAPSRADARLVERTNIGRLHTPQRREPAVARSPKAVPRIRSGLARALADQVTSRCEEVVE